jgi:predicted SpoU family rRNA methylase
MTKLCDILPSFDMMGEEDVVLPRSSLGSVVDMITSPYIRTEIDVRVRIMFEKDGRPIQLEAYGRNVEEATRKVKEMVKKVI